MIACLLALALAQPDYAQIVPSGQGWQLVRAGEPIFLKGAGAPIDMLDELKAAGGNAVRTWGAGDELGPYLDRAQELGLMVVVGSWMLKEGDGGFSYADPADVASQVETIRREVRRWKDHPAVILWAVGNEMELGADPVLAFRAVEQAAQAVREEAPGMPVISVVADMWPEKMAAILGEASSLDALGVNSYGGLPSLHTRMEPWTRPYFITEFQTRSQGDMPQTAWGARIEPSSTEKAADARSAYEQAILGFPGRVLGSFVFYWGPSGSGTASWFNTHLSTSEKLEVVDVMTEFWSGAPQADLSPSVLSVDAPEERVFRPGAQLSVTLNARDPEGNPIDSRWELRSDDPTRRFVGDFEKDLGVLESGEGATANLRVPQEAGPYRLVLIARDGSGGAAVASVPFYVEDPR